MPIEKDGTDPNDGNSMFKGIQKRTSLNIRQEYKEKPEAPPGWKKDFKDAEEQARKQAEFEKHFNPSFEKKKRSKTESVLTKRKKQDHLPDWFFKAF